MSPPDFDSKPLYNEGRGHGWVGYGMFFEWPSACFQIFDWRGEDQQPTEYQRLNFGKLD